MKKNNQYKHLIVLVFLCMAIFGFIENVKGTLIPSIRVQFGVDYSSIGIMILISSFGYLFATLIGGLAADKLGKKVIIVLGFILLITAAGLFYLADSFPLTVALLFLISAGFGCIEVVVNSLGAQIFVRSAAVMMNLTHFFYGLGSSISPKYAGSMLARNLPWNYVYTITLAVLIPGLIYLAFLRFPEASVDDKNNKFPIAQIIRDKKIWLIIGTLGFCNTADIGIANWLVNYLQVVRGMDIEQSSLYMTFFFAAFMLGRLVGGLIAEKLGYIKTVLNFTIASIVLFTSGMLLSNTFVFLFSCIGFFVSIMFPTIISIIMKEYTSGTSSIMGFAMAVTGGITMIFNWVIGKINDIINVNAGFMSIAVYMLLAIMFIIPLGKVLTFDKSPNKKIVAKENLSPSA